MEIEKTKIEGVFIIKTTPFVDERGSFARLFCDNELKPIIKERKILQINHSITKQVGAIRGLHYQNPPFAEMKLVRCIKGKIFDVAVDIRCGSKTFLEYHAEELTAENKKMLVIPEGFAHGFQVLEENSEILYLHTAFYNKESENGLFYKDAKINIKWPIEVTDVSVRDTKHKLINKEFKGIKI